MLNKLRNIKKINLIKYTIATLFIFSFIQIPVDSKQIIESNSINNNKAYTNKRNYQKIIGIKPLVQEILEQYKEGASSLGELIYEEVENAKRKEKLKIKKKAVQRKQLKQINNVSDQILSLEKKDYEALLKIVEAEATGEDIKGKLLVANVVLNRVESKKFPNTIYDVVHDKKGGVQFSPISDGRYYKVNITESTKKAVEKALKGEDHSDGALYFVARAYASKKSVRWFDRALHKVAKYGSHEFYR